MAAGCFEHRYNTRIDIIHTYNPCIISMPAVIDSDSKQSLEEEERP